MTSHRNSWDQPGSYLSVDYETKLQQLLSKGRKKIRTPALALGLSVDGDHYFASSGYANLETRQDFTITSEFYIGKISEIFILGQKIGELEKFGRLFLVAQS